jgi:hypothetical protein
VFVLSRIFAYSVLKTAYVFKKEYDLTDKGMVVHFVGLSVVSLLQTLSEVKTLATLGFKLQLLPRGEGILIYVTLKCVHDVWCIERGYV